MTEEEKKNVQERFEEKFSTPKYDSILPRVSQEIIDFMLSEIGAVEKQRTNIKIQWKEPGGDWELITPEELALRSFKAGEAAMLEKVKTGIRKDRKFFEDEDHAVGGYRSVKEFDDFLSALHTNHE